MMIIYTYTMIYLSEKGKSDSKWWFRRPVASRESQKVTLKGVFQTHYNDK